MNTVQNFFKAFLERESFFIDKKVLQSFYTPENIPHRDKEVDAISKVLAPALKLELPSNLFLYGNTGTGKTLVAQYVTNWMTKLAEEKGIKLKVIYLNCKLKKVADTEYRLIAQLVRAFGKPIPSTGLPTNEIYNFFCQVLDQERQVMVLILDEIDQLIEKIGDGILYNLIRLNTDLKKSKISLVGISNNLVFMNALDPKVKSSLSEEEIQFPPYNALQIQDILRQRSEKAFRKEAIQPGVIEKCAAYAAREHGDARRALELLRVAGELAERQGKEKIEINQIDEAEDKIERDRVLDAIINLPRQSQAVIYAIIRLSEKKKNIFTGEIYEIYTKICSETKEINKLTQRRVSDMLAELDMMGIINAKIISKGRYGRTREISLSIASSTVPKIKEILDKAFGLK